MSTIWEAPLAVYLDQVSARPFAWGRLDCAMFAGDWVTRITGADPIAEFRGRYRTELGCARILKREGGLLALTERAALAAGLRPTETPTTGAVGVCRVLTSRGAQQATAIRVRACWAFLATSGLAVAPGEHIAAWEF